MNTAAPPATVARALLCSLCLLVPRLAAAQVPPGHLTPRRVPAPALLDPTLRRRLGVEVATQLLKSQNADERERGFERLGSVGSAQALDQILHAFDTGGAARSAKDRLVAVRALAPHAAVPAVRELLVRVMVGVGSNPERAEAIDGLIESAAALALAGSGDDAALTALGKALRQPGHIAETAREALLAFPPRVLEPITEGRSSPTRILANFLGDLGDPRAIPALRELVRTSEGAVRAEAAVSLAKLGVEETLELARHWLEHETNPELRAASVRILLHFEAPDAALGLKRLLTDPATHAIALDLAGDGSFPGLVPALMAAAQSAEVSEQSALFAALGHAGNREAFSFLGGALSTHRSSSPAALALALSASSDAEHVIATALSAPSTRRVAIRAALVRRSAHLSQPSGLESALREGREPTDRALRAAALSLLSPGKVPEFVNQAETPELLALARSAFLPGIAPALASRLAVEQNPVRRLALASCLVSFTAAERVPTQVLLALLDEQNLAAPLAARALAARDSRALRPKIASLLSSDDALLRAHTALGLGLSADGSALGLLERAYHFETDARVRLAIVNALGLRHEPARARVLHLARTLDASAKVREASALALAGARPSLAETGPQTAWLDFDVLDHGTTAATLLITESGLAVPFFADPDGILLVPGLATGAFELRLAAPTRTDDAPPPRQP